MPKAQTATMERALNQSEQDAVGQLLQAIGPNQQWRADAQVATEELVRKLRAASDKGSFVEQMLAEYSLGNPEGLALMTLAEAYLRTPDHSTRKLLLADKLVGKDWRRHIGRSKFARVNTATVMLAGYSALLRRWPGSDFLYSGARLGAGFAMRAVAANFVLGEDIEQALNRSRKLTGYSFSFDMLGEAALCAADVDEYNRAYTDAIEAVGQKRAHAEREKVHLNSGVSVKLSALHARYHESKHAAVHAELGARLRSLLEQAAAANIPLSLDAEECARLPLQLDLVEQELTKAKLADWQGFSLVVQAYTRAAPAVIDWYCALAQRLQRRLALRLVKGAYWDSEIKLAQQAGAADYQVFTRKHNTDLCYLVCAQKLLDNAQWVYPQFATHNAHSVCALQQLAKERRVGKDDFEFQRLQGMGVQLHQQLLGDGYRSRVYAPVGGHQDLLAYLVRRLLENGANSSFVHQLQDEAIEPQQLAADPILVALTNFNAGQAAQPAIALPAALFQPQRRNSAGVLLEDRWQRDGLEVELATRWGQNWDLRRAGSTGVQSVNPADHNDVVGFYNEVNPNQVLAFITKAENASKAWSARPVGERAQALLQAADSYEANRVELMALLTREAGKTRDDALAEVREAVDFLRYYAQQALSLGAFEAVGTVVCISPWNFPLAIFTGQIAAALVAGNSVLAKPAEQSPLIALRAVQLLQQSGIPQEALQLLPGSGAVVGARLTADPRVNAVLFTGSEATAAAIDRQLAEHGNAKAPLVAETGGVNAMIVDSSALPEQVVRDAIGSAFLSAGQRCSALRLLCVQEKGSERIIELLKGAMQELQLGDPREPTTDIGPLIDAAALQRVQAYCQRMQQECQLVAQAPLDAALAQQGHFLAPCLFKLNKLNQLDREVFAPVLHLYVYRSSELDSLIKDINAKGYGLTFGVHSRIQSRCQQLARAVRVGSAYINRNTTGAVVGCQPFGGCGLSGTGPKAGGPNYLLRLLRLPTTPASTPTDLPAVTGESNTYYLEPRARVLVVAESNDSSLRAALETAKQAFEQVLVGADCPKVDSDWLQKQEKLERSTLTSLDICQSQEIDAVLLAQPPADSKTLRALRLALAQRPGARVPLYQHPVPVSLLQRELVISEDTTASGGNASLLLTE